MSLFTPQKGESSEEILPPLTRTAVLDELSGLCRRYPKLDLSRKLLDVYRRPPRNPRDCIFARTNLSISADLKRKIVPCQFGGNPDCSQCGCVASAGLGAIGRHKLLFGVELAQIYTVSRFIGQNVNVLREACRPVDHKKEPPVSVLGSGSGPEADLGV